MSNKISHTSSIEICSREKTEELRLFLKDEREKYSGDVNAMLQPVYDSINYDECILEVVYEALPWEGNRVGILHGGITGTMMDHAAASAIFVFLGYWCPTVDMDIKFIRQMKVGEKLRCNAKIIHIGRRFITVYSEMYDEKTGNVTATALFTYANGASSIGQKK